MEFRAVASLARASSFGSVGHLKGAILKLEKCIALTQILEEQGLCLTMLKILSLI